MKYKFLFFLLIFSQIAYSQAFNENKERLKKRFSPQKNWHSVIFMEELNIEGDNGMTWRNQSESYMIDIEFEPNGATDFGVRVLLKEKINQEAIVGYQANNEQLYINSSNAGKADSVNVLGLFFAPMKIDRGRVKMQIFINKNSIEVFGNDGESFVKSRVFAEENSTDWQIFANGRAKVTKLEVWEWRE